MEELLLRGHQHDDDGYGDYLYYDGDGDDECRDYDDGRDNR